MDLIEHLRTQLDFLRFSSEGFDRGYRKEGIRIATIIRTLLHQTDRSNSLLSQLGKTDIRLVSSCPSIPSSAVYSSGMLSNAVVTIGTRMISSGQYAPTLEIAPNALGPIPMAEWWNQAIYRTGGIDITRRDIVLGAAHKDGGAHVDLALGDKYAAVKGHTASMQLNLNEQPRQHIFAEPHLSDLRQMAFELLNSPELSALTDA